MRPSAWRSAWTAVVRCGRTTYTAPVLLLPRGRIFPERVVGGVADGSGFMADLSTLKVNSNLVSRAGAPVLANGPSEVRLVEAALAARCGDKGPTWLRRYAASITLARRDQIQYEETMPWRSAEVAVNLGGGGGGGDTARFNFLTMVLSGDHLLPAFGGLKVLFEDPCVSAFDLKCRSFIVSDVFSSSRLLFDKLGGNLHGFQYICNLAVATMISELWCQRQFNKLQIGPSNFGSIYGITLANKVIVGIGAKSSVGPFKTVGVTFGSTKLPQRMFSTSQCLSHEQRGRSFSTRQSQTKSMMHIELLRPKNTGVLCLDGENHDVLLSFRKIIAQIRDYCHEYGKRVDLSLLYGRACEVYTPPGDGSFHVVVQHCGRSYRISISARDLYVRAFRGGNHKPLELQVDDDDDRATDYSYISSEEDHTVLPFSGSYTSLCGGDIKGTWIGVAALRHAFHALDNYDGSGTDLLKQAITIFVIHLSEASRLQPVFNAISRSMVNDNINYLDDVSQLSDDATQKASSLPSWWVSNYGWYSREAMEAVDRLITCNQKYSIANRRGDKAGDPPLAPPRESPPTDTGKEADYPYWKKPEEYVYNSTRNLFYFHSTSKSLMRNKSSNLLKQWDCLEMLQRNEAIFQVIPHLKVFACIASEQKEPVLTTFKSVGSMTMNQSCWCTETGTYWHIALLNAELVQKADSK
ncbi:rRNA N-glycosidase [Hordeum vulgare]|nr:rRNA N-glycosidase [Hordeum vulgare]